MNGKTNVTFQNELLHEVDKIVKERANGYRSRASFCEESVRLRIHEIKRLNNLNGNNGPIIHQTGEI